MKKALTTSIIINIIFLLILISMYNTTIQWDSNGETHAHKLGDFFAERLRGE